MDSKNIDQLLEKYWSCETTLEEEEVLRAYYRDHPEEGRESGILFQYFNEEKKKQLPITEEELFENLPEEVVMEASKVNETPAGGHYLPWVGTLTKLAAVLVVLLGVTFYLNREQVKEETLTLLETDTYEDTQKAYEETVKALNLISKHLNAGKAQTMKLAKFNEAEKAVQESIVN
jgi:hypothetical protein